ncbi:MAG TPA: hypothetical protein VMT45_13330 [Thermoanaerobaculaceae bacterium]|nr:hypothetical protein [Thermoanaerobaculaceae bacterium]
MDLPPMTCVDFDGSITNPLELGAMGIWLLVLLVALVPVAFWAGRRVRIRYPVAWALGIAVVFVIPSAIARVFLATWLYRLRHPDVVSVGFFGGISPFLVPALAAVAWLATYHMVARRVGTTRGSEPP